jgi:hypothetical protein
MIYQYFAIRLNAGSSFGPYNIYYDQIGEDNFVYRAFTNYKIRNFPFGPESQWFLNATGTNSIITFPYSATTLIVYNVACQKVVSTLTITATTPTQTPSRTPTQTPTYSQTPTNTPTYTQTPTNTPTFTSTPSQTQSETPTNTPTNTETPTQTPTLTQTPTKTRFTFAGITGSTSNDACTGSASVVFYGEEAQFDQNIQLFNNLTGPATINMASYFQYNSIVVQLDSGGNTIGAYTLCPP